MSFAFVAGASNDISSPKPTFKIQKVEKNIYKSIDETWYVCKTGCKGSKCVGVGTTYKEASDNADAAVKQSCGFSGDPIFESM